MHAASNDVRVEERGLVFIFLFFFPLPYLTQCSGWWDGGVWRGKGGGVGMYVRTMASCLFFLFHSLSSRRSHRLEKRGWIGGWAGRTGGYSKRCQTVQALARDFRLGLAGGGWDDSKLELSSSTGHSNLNLLIHW